MSAELGAKLCERESVRAVVVTSTSYFSWNYSSTLIFLIQPPPLFIRLRGMNVVVAGDRKRQCRTPVSKKKEKKTEFPE
jgi:hypothetical protein